MRSLKFSFFVLMMSLSHCRSREELAGNGGSSSSLAEISFEGIPEGTNKEKSRVKITHLQAGDVKDLSLIEAESLFLDEGRYSFSIKIYKGEELFAETGLTDKCKPFEADIKLGAENSIRIPACKVGTADQVINNPTDVDIGVDVVDGGPASVPTGTVDYWADRAFEVYMENRAGQGNPKTLAFKALDNTRIVVTDFVQQDITNVVTSAELVDKRRFVVTKGDYIQANSPVGSMRNFKFDISCFEVRPGFEDIKKKDPRKIVLNGKVLSIRSSELTLNDCFEVK